ncbi:ABC transporter, membrane component [marine actinobacterium PHSC20C1]|nr:ABC transporter, membrane component [marine actinobacterium PHSC20C1]
MTVVTPEQHGLKAHSDGGWDAEDKNFVPVQTRSGRPKSFEHSDFAPVTGIEADWKLTPVKLIKPLLDDALDGSAYTFTTDAPAGVTVEWIARDDKRIASAGAPEERASANAWTSFEQALAITVTSEEHVTLRISRADLGNTARGAHTVITARPHSNSTIIVESSGDALLSENVEVVVEEGASLNFVSVQDWNDEAIHLASHFVQVGRDATLKHTVISLGGKVVRVNPAVHLSGEGADGELYGLYFADEGQHLEQRVYMHHKAAHTRGRVNYKGALQGAGARTVWVGDVLIGRDGAGTDSYEQNRNLVLTEGTRADSIPNLEIETGDIQGAGHASATGRFDDEQLFYLQARGISEAEARRLVVIGFLSEIVQKVGDEQLEARLHSAIESELEGSKA